MIDADVVVERTVHLDASPHEVWDALTNAGRLSVWVGGAVEELEVRPGGRGIVRRGDGAVRRLIIEALDAERRLVLRWWPFSDGGGPPPAGSGTRVEFELELTQPTGTVLRVREFPPLVGVEPIPRTELSNLRAAVG
ncbi:MAG TPA: SRPBCC domain-containing protein [Actinomycetota bacterium]